MFAEVTILSQVDPDDFPFDWFAIAREDHFWFRSRIQAFKRFARRFEDFSQPKKVLEIGCGNGLVRRQLESFTQWKTDGADISHEALKLNTGVKGETFLYNIHERKAELKEQYDVVILFDVLEHIPDTTEFLESCLFHLKPGGMLYINVPSLNKYRSDYDIVVGHIRRYDKKMMAEEFKNLPAKVLGQRYWALSLVPALIARKYIVKQKEKDIAQVVEKGLVPPNKLIDSAFYSLLQLENSLFSNPFTGASLLAAIQKDSHGE
ncbi:MAG: class I SAM-dependent methyltransferase [Bacteroidetes bacterium]|nr:MAG: class I SAM-dependent methyltransferase [Bacteroidota bacterium]